MFAFLAGLFIVIWLFVTDFRLNKSNKLLKACLEELIEIKKGERK